MANFDVSNPKFNENLRKLEICDLRNADTFNPVLHQLIMNDIRIAKEIEAFYNPTVIPEPDPEPPIVEPDPNPPEPEPDPEPEPKPPVVEPEDMSATIAINPVNPSSGDDVAISTVVTGGSEPFYYKYSIYYESGDIEVLRDYSTDPNCTIAITTPGTHRIRVDIRDSNYTTVYKYFTIVVKAKINIPQSGNEKALDILISKKDGKKYGVFFNDFVISPNPSGSRLYDAVGMQAKPSTNTTRGVNNFDNRSVFYGLEVNGYVDSSGEFVVEYIKDFDEGFSRTDRNVYVLFNTQYIKLTITSNGEELVLSDTQHEGFIPEGAAIRTDGTIRPFVAIAKYMANVTDNAVYSRSGQIPTTQASYEGSRNKIRGLVGKQYCSTTAQDVAHMQNLFMVAFATRDLKSVMYGNVKYYHAYTASVEESNTNRVVIKNYEANNLIVGTVAGIKYSDTNGSIISGPYLIDRIEKYNDANKAVYLRDANISTKSVTNANGNVRKIQIAALSWPTGTCDNVLGSCGSPTSNTSGKEPFILFGVEMFLGLYEVVGNVILVSQDYAQIPYICYDSYYLTMLPEKNFVPVAYSLNFQGEASQYRYISKLGYDPDNPSVRYGIECNATLSTGYASSQYTHMNALGKFYAEACMFGNQNGEGTGIFSSYLDFSSSVGVMRGGYRLSASGRCAQKSK